MNMVDYYLYANRHATRAGTKVFSNAILEVVERYPSDDILAKQARGEKAVV